jgi:hypothetical protein
VAAAGHLRDDIAPHVLALSSPAPPPVLAAACSVIATLAGPATRAPAAAAVAGSGALPAIASALPKLRNDRDRCVAVLAALSEVVRCSAASDSEAALGELDEALTGGAALARNIVACLHKHKDDARVCELACRCLGLISGECADASADPEEGDARRRNVLNSACVAPAVAVLVRHPGGGGGAAQAAGLLLLDVGRFTRSSDAVTYSSALAEPALRFVPALLEAAAIADRETSALANAARHFGRLFFETRNQSMLAADCLRGAMELAQYGHNAGASATALLMQLLQCLPPQSPEWLELRQRARAAPALAHAHKPSSFRREDTSHELDVTAECVACALPLVVARFSCDECGGAFARCQLCHELLA